MNDGVKFPVVGEVMLDEFDVGDGSEIPTAAQVALVKT